MPESHARFSQYYHDFVLGFADGITVPFALTAGLSSLGSTRFVIIGGLAELFSGAISMSIGSYLAASTERQRYENERLREAAEVEQQREKEVEEVFDILCAYGPTRSEAKPYVDSLCTSKKNWIDVGHAPPRRYHADEQFMMDLELKLQKPTRQEAYICGATMGIGYLLGGILPMIPYFIAKRVTTALFISIGITCFVLLVFGFGKSKLLGGTMRQAVESSVKTLAVGVLAAGASYGIVRAVDSSHHL